MRADEQDRQPVKEQAGRSADGASSEEGLTGDGAIIWHTYMHMVCPSSNGLHPCSAAEGNPWGKLTG